MRVREILSTHYPQYIDAATDAKIRARYRIQLSESDMRADSGRW